jgi:uncharacterized phage-associated protein
MRAGRYATNRIRARSPVCPSEMPGEAIPPTSIGNICGMSGRLPSMPDRSEFIMMALRAPYDGRAVANLLLDVAEEHGEFLTQLSLYKILYFAQGWYLVEKGQPLVKQDFEAWKYGPVIKAVRDEFHSFGDRPIRTRALKLDIYSGNKIEIKPEFPDEDRRFVSNIYLVYHVHDAWKLSEMTHERGSPWDRLWNTALPIGRLALRLRNDDIKAHFDGLPKRLRV